MDILSILLPFLLRNEVQPQQLEHLHFFLRGGLDILVWNWKGNYYFLYVDYETLNKGSSNTFLSTDRVAPIDLDE